MKTRILTWLFLPAMFIWFAGASWAEDDNRAIGKFEHTGPREHLRIVSAYLVFDGQEAAGLPGIPSGNETRFYSRIWDDLYLQVTTESGEKGVISYKFSFSKDQENQNLLAAEEVKGLPTLREVSAADFRTEDNFASRPLKGGPGVPRDRGVLRLLHYKDFDVEIRMLEFSVGDAKLGKKPYLKSLTCLVTVKEKASAEGAKPK